MNEYTLTVEHIIDLLIFWIAGSNGQIDYEENKEINEILADLSYDPKSFQDTINYLNGLRTTEIDRLIDQAIEKADSFKKERKRYMVIVLRNVAQSDGHIAKSEQKKLDILREKWGLVSKD